MLNSEFDASEATPESTPPRDAINDKYQWDLSHIYPDWETWNNDLQFIKSEIESLKSFQGKLNNSRILLDWYKKNDELEKIADKIYSYAFMKLDEDQRKNDINAYKQKALILFAQWENAVSWFTPELLKIPWTTIESWLNSSKELQQYRFNIKETYRQKDHVLDEEGEVLIAYSSRLKNTPNEVYTMLSTADIDYPVIKLEDGRQVQLSYGKYYNILQTNRNQTDRKLAFESFYRVFEKNINTYAALYNGVCQKDLFSARCRKHKSTLSAKLFANNIPETVVKNLIEVVKSGVKPLRQYYQLRKKIMKLEEIHLYDGSIPLINLDIKYKYEEAIDEVIDSVKPLGEEYQDQVKIAFNSRWLDVFENEGKRSGAYSAGVYGVHPYMLLNYNDTLDDVFTVAHEMGHTMHSVLSHATQPINTSSYTIFVAEVASTLNEALLLKHLLSKTQDPKKRILLLEQSIHNIVGTFYTQVMFADFELQVHEMVENDQPITAEVLNKIYFDLLEIYYGDTVILDDLYKITWARIGHFFHAPYYVYQYATCFASSAVIMKKLNSEDQSICEEALDNYLTLLKSGGNDQPMKQLKKAGVDLEKAETIQAVIDQFEVLVKQLDTEITKII